MEVIFPLAHFGHSPTICKNLPARRSRVASQRDCRVRQSEGLHDLIVETELMEEICVSEAFDFHERLAGLETFPGTDPTDTCGR
jgi:hypothetical protein